MTQPTVNDSTAVLRSRLAYTLGKSHGGNRNLYESFGYPLDVSTESLWGMYQRNDIASRIIRSYPSATWREEPVIRDEEGDSSEKGGEGYSAFVEAVEDYFDEHKLLRTLERVDRLASIGRYGVLFLGFNDGMSPRLPRPSKCKLLFAQPYGELGVTVSKWCSDVRNPRFGLPELYTLNAAASSDARQVSPKKSITAHWTRVIHVAEYLDQDDVYGSPRLLPVYNRLMDLEKVVGGSAESFWLNATRMVSISADKDSNLDDDQIAAMKEQAEEMAHQTRRWVVGQGITLGGLSVEQADPEPNVTTLLDLIAGATGIPKRILIGSERGELSSAQDENNWSERTDERRRNFATPSLLRPLVDILISVGELPEPQGKWWVEWPEINTQDPVAESTIAMNRASAISTYANSPSAEFVVPMQEFRKDVLGMPPESDYDVPEIEEIEEFEAPEEEEDVPPALASKSNMEARSAYVRRDVLNVGELQKWAKAQGITLQEGLHVTVMYCKNKVDWGKIGNGWTGDDEGHLMVHPGGPRQVNELKSWKANGTLPVVLEFACDGIEWRHREMKERGAVHSFPTYRPHITLFYHNDPQFDPSTIEPYTGAIALGPEIWEEVR